MSALPPWRTRIENIYIYIYMDMPWNKEIKDLNILLSYLYKNKLDRKTELKQILQKQ